MLPPKQVYEMLGVSDSTLRRWSRLFKEHLSESARKKRRMYTQSDLATLSQIKELLSEGVYLADIPDRLPDYVDVDNTETALSLPGLVVMMDDLRSQLSEALTRQNELERRLEQLEKPFWKRILKRQESPRDTE